MLPEGLFDGLEVIAKRKEKISAFFSLAFVILTSRKKN